MEQWSRINPGVRMHQINETKMIRWQGSVEQHHKIKVLAAQKNISIAGLIRDSVEAVHGEALRELGYFDVDGVSENDHRAKSA